MFEVLKSEIKDHGLFGLGKRLLFGNSKPSRIEVSGDKPELQMGWIRNDFQQYLFEDPFLGFASTHNFGQAYDMYRDMEIKWPYYSHLVQKRKNAVLSKVLNINSPSNDDKDIEISQFCQDAIDGIIKFRQDISEILECISFGFSVSEIMYGVRDGRWIIHELKSRQQERFRFLNEQRWGLDMDGTRSTFKPIDPYKFVIAQYNTEYEKPYGRGEARYCYWYFYYQSNGLKFWSIFCDKFGSPTTLGRYPSGIETKDQNEILKVLETIQTSQNIVLPDNIMIELLEAKRTGSINCYKDFIDYFEQSVSKRVLGSTLTSNEGRFGTRAQATVHEKSRDEITTADCLLMQAIIKDQIIKPLVGYNFGFDVTLPDIQFDLEPPEDLKKRAETDEILVTKLNVPLDKSYFYKTYQRPEPEEKEDRNEDTTEEIEKVEEEVEDEVEKEDDEEKDGDVEDEDIDERMKHGEDFGKSRLIFAETDEIANARRLFGKWSLNETRYYNNAIDDGKEFYFGLMDWIKEGIDTAQSDWDIYNLDTDLAVPEVTKLANYMTSMIFTAELNGMLEIGRMAEERGLSFSEGKELGVRPAARGLTPVGSSLGRDLGSGPLAIGSRGLTPVGSSLGKLGVRPAARGLTPAGSSLGSLLRFQEFGEYQFIPLEPEAAIEYFEGLVPLTRDQFYRNLSSARATAFTVSGIQKTDVIAKVQDSLTQAIRKGETFDAWKARTNEMLDNLGVTRIKPFRMQTIYYTNIHNAMIRGRDMMSQELVRRGIMTHGMGVSAGDDRVRERHESFNGAIMPWNDARWDYLNEYGCRCNKMPYFGRR